MTREAVHHPSHYGGADDIYEHIKVAEALGWGYHLGNATKYIWRAGKKSRSTTIQDLKKAAWYLGREIQRLEGLAASAHAVRALRRAGRGAISATPSRNSRNRTTAKKRS